MGSAELRTVAVPCPHCGRTEAQRIWSGREHEYPETSSEEFPFVRCEHCGLVRLSPRPHVDALPRIYPPSYYAYHLADQPDGGLGVGDRIKRRMYQGRFRKIAARLGDRPRLRVLDVGCADGRLLDWYRTSGAAPVIETHGIEMDDSAAAKARARGHRVVTGRFEEDRDLEEGSFDIITALHVIEHVADPLRFAMRAAGLLAPGGLLVVATPNLGCAEARVLKGHWGGNHTPRHWTLYEEATIGDLARRVDLELARVEYQPNPIFWVWSLHSLLAERFPRARWPDRLFPPVEIFQPGARSLLLLSFFTFVDLAARLTTGRTGSMSVEMRKPIREGAASAPG